MNKTNETKLKQGTKVRCNGYDGVIVRHYNGAMYEIRLPGGVCCTDDFTVTGEGNAPRELSDAVKRVLAFDPSAFGKSRRTVREPVKIEKPNVELFDDHTHNEA